MLELGLKVLISYLLGSINGSLVLGRFRGIDIRTQGSGNAGGTNALRTQGWPFALGVMLIDVGKGFLPCWFLPDAEILGLGLDPQIARSWLAVACAAAAVHGHCYPVWFGFKGGKGAATLIGTLLALAPMLLAPLLMVWIAVLIMTGMVGLATMLATLSLPVYLLAMGSAWYRPMVLFTLLAAAYIAYTHRENIQRMRLGQENQMRKAMLFRRR